jgi:hypothetical protein
VVDEWGKLPGRGAYLCVCRECLEKARKTNALARALKTKIADALYDQLGEYIETCREKNEKNGGQRDEERIGRELRALLGLSRRAKLVHIGIDSVKSQRGRSGAKGSLLILTAADSSESVKDAVRKQIEGEECGHVHISVPLDIEAFSAAVGASKVQVVALPMGNGLTKKIKMLLSASGEAELQEGGVALEQNESI